MSSLIKAIGTNYKNIPTLLQVYDNDLLGYENNLTMKGKTLEHSLKEQASLVAYYAERKVELKTILSYLETQTKQVRALLYVQYNEQYSRSLGDRAIERYIDREEKYVEICNYVIEVEEVLEKYTMLIDAFNRRGFALRDITAARINLINDVTL